MTLGTPLSVDYTFRYDQYFDVLARIVPYLRPGVVLIARSTVSPHFTRNVVMARIAAERDWVPGRDFFVAYCPERLLQGNALRDIDELPEIIGADDPETARRATDLFLSLGREKRCLHVTTVEAELGKLFLNAYRYTLFGLANEFAMAAEQHGTDVHAILEAANAEYVRGGIPQPGPSRGPCLDKDTAALAWGSASSLIAHAALKTNANVVLHVAAGLRTALGSLVHRKVSILGCAFKADSEDTRDNLTAPLAHLLEREGATTAVFDPLVGQYTDPGVLVGSDALVLMTAHRQLRELAEDDVERLCGRPRREVFVFDLWNVWPWADRIFGKGWDEAHEDPCHRGVRLVDAAGRPSTP
jgi:UDP-N-acetyl-D-mannosaminuronic acid dehydrogenase